ncbi:thiamine-phosphate kinase [Candidatus Caldatribacterium saccharofermentans]|uniref:thiamine-phosphate kinase n=1 Tax=Candidatus Caldatribacterium saccharofermentans TaxID=1454753 RepID=UPI003D06AA31
MELRDLGEFGLIARIRNVFSSTVPLGIGDDCAVLPGREGFWFLATVDSQIEGVHFQASLIPPFFVGRRLLVANLSDIAAMGGIPRYALLSFALREDVSFVWLNEVLQGVQEEASRHGVEVVGGNLARIDGPAVLDLVLLGEVERDRPLLLRGNARPGDWIFVTGYPGEAKAGLILAGRKVLEEQYRGLWQRFFAASPRLDVGRFLGALGERIALIDVSDGLLQDLGHILEESHVGAILYEDALPVSPLLAQFCEKEGCDPQEFVLRGGEDFELLFTVPPHRGEEIQEEIPRRFGLPVHRVGEIVEGAGVYLRKKDTLVPLASQGFNHFSRKE